MSWKRSVIKFSLPCLGLRVYALASELFTWRKHVTAVDMGVFLLLYIQLVGGVA